MNYPDKWHEAVRALRQFSSDHGRDLANGLVDLFCPHVNQLKEADYQAVIDLAKNPEEVRTRVEAKRQEDLIRKEVAAFKRCATCGVAFIEGDRIQVVSDEARLLYVCADDKHKVR